MKKYNYKQLKLSDQDLTISFEFFPPKTDKMEETLWSSIARLSVLNPTFVSVTYGAGGSTRERTHSTVSRIVKDTHLKPAAHLTCVAATKDDVNEVIQSYWDAGVRHIVALRGDPPEGIGHKYEPFPGGYAGSVELVKGIKEIGDFEVSVSAYPEKHPESSSLESDLDLLQAKVDAGADRAITQFFFDNEHYFRFLEAVTARGINIPITPGIIPIHSFKQITKFSEQCGTSIPNWLAQRFEGLDDDPETRKLISATVVAEQVQDLVEHGIKDFHFYTLNRADLVYAICHLLGVRPSAMQA